MAENCPTYYQHLVTGSWDCVIDLASDKSSRTTLVFRKTVCRVCLYFYWLLHPEIGAKSCYANFWLFERNRLGNAHCSYRHQQGNRIFNWFINH